MLWERLLFSIGGAAYGEGGFLREKKLDEQLSNRHSLEKKTRRIMNIREEGTRLEKRAHPGLQECGGKLRSEGEKGPRRLDHTLGILAEEVMPGVFIGVCPPFGR